MAMLDCPVPQASSTQAASGLAPVYNVVVIGGSAGGILALIRLLSALPADFALPILVAQHLSATFPSKLPAVLGWRTPLRVKWAEDGEWMAPGTVYIAPPDRHLLVRPYRRVGLSTGDRVGRWRPAVDALFLSAAEIYGDSVAAIVLSGMLDDGARGMAAVAKRGGITIAQDEASADHFEMPGAARDLGRADIAMSPQKIAQALQVLAELAA